MEAPEGYPSGDYDPTADKKTTDTGGVAPEQPVPSTAYSLVRAYKPAGPAGRPQQGPLEPGALTFFLALAGIVLVLVAMLISASLVKVTAEDMLDNLHLASSVLLSIGMASLSMGLIYGAVRDTMLGDRVRFGLAIAAGLIIGLGF